MHDRELLRDVWMERRTATKSKAMMSQSEDRELTSVERRLVEWLLEHGVEAAQTHLPLRPDLRVVASCTCGCASIDFVDRRGSGVKVLSDYQFTDADGHHNGVFVFESAGQLAGLEVWSMDGGSDASELPPLDTLEPFA